MSTSTTAWMQLVFPFADATPGNTQQLFTADVLIEENNPGIIFAGTENNAAYFEAREVGGDFYIATNATLSASGWALINLASPAYATVFRANGTQQRVTSPAGISGVVWQVITSTNADGTLSLPTLPLTTAAQVGAQVSPTWNAGSAVMTALLVNATDVTSAATSKLFDLQTNGVSKFTVDKTGAVNFVGALTSTNLNTGNITATGTVNVSGTATFGSTLSATGLATLSSGATLAGNLSGTTANFSGLVAPAAGLHVLGGFTSDTVSVSGTSTFTGAVTATASVTTPTIYFGSNGTPYIANDQAPAAGLIVSCPTSTTYGMRWFTGTSNTAQLNPIGALYTANDIHAGFVNNAVFYGNGAYLGTGTYGASASIPGGATIGSINNTGTETIAGTLTANGTSNFNGAVALGSTFSSAGTATLSGSTNLNGPTYVSGTPLATYINQQAAYAVGSVVEAFARFSASGTYGLGVLPAGGWDVYFESGSDPSSGVTIGVSGSGISWEAGYTATAVGGGTILNLSGTGSGGQSPTVALTYSGSPNGPVNIPPWIRFTARRTS